MLENYSDFLKLIADIQKDAENFTGDSVCVDIRKIEGRKAFLFVTCWDVTIPATIEWQRGWVGFFIPEHRISWPWFDMSEIEFAKDFLWQVERMAGMDYIESYRHKNE